MKLSIQHIRQLHVFKSNKRAFISLIIFTALFIFSLCAELVANDKPLLISFKGELISPLFSDYPETFFGGDYDTNADYKDPYVQALINADGYIIYPLIPFSYDTHSDVLSSPAPSKPDANHWLGTDDQARDVLARVIYGFRLSIVFALAVTIGSSAIGIAIGAMQGYFGGWIDLVGQRILEIWSALPVLFLLIILSSIITPSFFWLLFIVLMFSWTGLVDLVRAEALKVRKYDYVRAAKTLGVSHTHIIFKHIIPNACVSALTFIPFMMTGAIATLTSLDFLGFGLPPGSPSLGELLAQGKANIHAPWLGLTAFLSISTLLTLLVFIGEGIRDAMDPRLQKEAR
ncbi:MAG: ABC transporter permease [Sinobacterium sp.]|nr:ABC transporter permease [Sinobacterium sp.]